MMRSPIGGPRRLVLWLFALPFALMIWAAQPAGAFDIAIGNEQSATYRLGIGISSLIKIKLLPREEIDLRPMITASDEASLEALRNGEASFALIAADQSRPLAGDGIAAVASLGGIGSQPAKLLARNDADDTSVRRILETIFENIPFLGTIDPAMQDLTADSAVMGLTLPLHGGAKRFHASRWASDGEAPAAPDAPAPSTPATPTGEATVSGAPEDDRQPADARNYVLYFGFDDDVLDQTARTTLAKAASFAETLDGAAIIVAAYTDSVGDAEYNYLLAERRAASVVQGLEALDVRYSRLDLSLFGERSPWAVTLDNVNEASNRRVELFIEKPVAEVRPLPVGAN